MFYYLKLLKCYFTCLSEHLTSLNDGYVLPFALQLVLFFIQKSKYPRFESLPKAFAFSSARGPRISMILDQFVCDVLNFQIPDRKNSKNEDPIPTSFKDLGVGLPTRVFPFHLRSQTSHKYLHLAK